MGYTVNAFLIFLDQSLRKSRDEGRYQPCYVCRPTTWPSARR